MDEWYPGAMQWMLSPDGLPSTMLDHFGGTAWDGRKVHGEQMSTRGRPAAPLP